MTTTIAPRTVPTDLQAKRVETPPKQAEVAETEPLDELEATGDVEGEEGLDDVDETQDLSTGPTDGFERKQVARTPGVTNDPFLQMVDRNASRLENKADGKVANLQSDQDYMRMLGLEDGELSPAENQILETGQGLVDLEKGDAQIVHDQGANARETAGEFVRLRTEMFDRAEGEGQARTPQGYIDGAKSPEEKDLRTRKVELAQTLATSVKDGQETVDESQKMGELGTAVDARSEAQRVRTEMFDRAESEGQPRTFDGYVAGARDPADKSLRETKVSLVELTDRVTQDGKIDKNEQLQLQLKATMVELKEGSTDLMTKRKPTEELKPLERSEAQKS